MSDALVLDSSALLALIWAEPGADKVAGVLDRAVMSAVNLGECVAKLTERGHPADEIIARLAQLPIEIIAHDRAQAEVAGALRTTTRGHGLSYGDRACLALAAALGAPALTTDRAWAGLEAGGATVHLIR